MPSERETRDDSTTRWKWFPIRQNACIRQPNPRTARPRRTSQHRRSSSDRTIHVPFTPRVVTW
jgi:hypothetical protein